MKKIAIIAPACALMLLGMNSCGLAQWAVMNDPNATNAQRGAVVGVTSGANTGAFIGSITSDWHNHDSNTLMGAAIGAVAGGLIGNAIGSSMDNKQAQQQQHHASGDNYYGNDQYYNRQQPYSQQQQYSQQQGVNTYNSYGDNAVYFASGKSNLTDAAKRRLDGIATSLRTDRTLVAEVYGHTDNDEHGKPLGEVSSKRALSVKKYLVSRGASDSQVYCKGCRDQYPVADNSTGEGRSRNRRAEVALTHSEPASSATSSQGVLDEDKWHF